MSKYLLLFIVLILFFMVVLNKINLFKNKKKESFNVNSSILSLNRLILKFNEEKNGVAGIEVLETLDSINI